MVLWMMSPSTRAVADRRTFRPRTRPTTRPFTTISSATISPDGGAFADDKLMGADIAPDGAFDLDIALGLDIALDRQIRGQDRGRRARTRAPLAAAAGTS